MANGKLLRNLIRAARDGNENSFREIVEKVIEDEREKQHHLLANDLEHILYGRPHLSLLKATINQEIPSDKESGLELLELREPTKALKDVVLSGENLAQIERVILEHNRNELIKSYGLRPVNKVLFYGPPGCGKTIASEVIANELSYTLAIVRLDSVISSYLGQTASNLRKVFDFISQGTYVVLFDEFDAFAKERGIDSEHGELKRVVNAFLQMIDSFTGNSILIAATNHEGLLDSAVWRRFDVVVEFSKPDCKQIKELLKNKLRGVRRDFEFDEKEIAPLFIGMSHADIERVILASIKSMILEGREFLTGIHLRRALEAEIARQQVTSNA